MTNTGHRLSATQQAMIDWHARVERGESTLGIPNPHSSRSRDKTIAVLIHLGLIVRGADPKWPAALTLTDAGRAAAR